MAKFNMNKNYKTINDAGGEAYKKSPEMTLIGLLLTSTGSSDYYRPQHQIFKLLTDAIQQVDPLFAAKAIVYARTQFGMRTITHVATSVLATRISELKLKARWSKQFFEQVVYRVDDMTEIVGYHFSRKQKLSSAMKAGFKLAFNKFNGYQLAKYRSSHKTIKLVDIANLVHPIPTAENKDALSLLIENNLSSHETWEAMLTKAGQDGNDDVEVAMLKANAWKTLLEENKLGYFALLRNLRNIIAQAPDCKQLALQKLVDPNAIAKSLVFPFRYLTAADANSTDRETVYRISEACDIALSNVPIFEGKTLIALDISGSMGSCMKQASLFAAVLHRVNLNSDLMVFNGDAKYIYEPPMSTLALSMKLAAMVSGSTNMNSIFNRAGRTKYDRIIIISDNENWVGFKAANDTFKRWKQMVDCDPYVYSIDMIGNATSQFPERNIFILGGFSDKIFDVMKLLEQDRNALFNTINTQINFEESK